MSKFSKKLPWSMYSVIASFPIEELLDEMKAKGTRIVTAGDTEHSIKFDSIRYEVFVLNRTCVDCGLVGTIMRLENSKGNKSKIGSKPHFNLYGIREDGLYILMTMDHIIPRSRGGKDVLSNLQTMCAICNHQKGNLISADFESLCTKPKFGIPPQTNRLIDLASKHEDIEIRTLAIELLRSRAKHSNKLRIKIRDMNKLVGETNELTPAFLSKQGAIRGRTNRIEIYFSDTPNVCTDLDYRP